MNKRIYRFKICGLPKDKDFMNMPLGRQMEHFKAIQEFKESAKSIWVSQKRQSSTKAISEAKKLYDIKEFYCVFFDSENYKDDSFELWYR